MGLLQCIKLNARRTMLLKLIANVERYSELHELGKLQKPGMKGLEYCHPAHALDAIRAIRSAYEMLNAKKVAACWIKAGILTDGQAKEVCRKTEITYPSSYNSTPGYAASMEGNCNTDEMVPNDFLPVVAETALTDDNALPDVIDAIVNSECEDTHENIEKEISNWLSEVCGEETNRTGAVDKDPAQFVDYINEIELEREQEAEAEKERLREIEAEEIENSAMLQEKQSYANLKKGYEWLSDVVKEASSKNLPEEVEAKLVDALRTSKVKMMDAAPKKKQQNIGDFFSLS